MQPHQHSAEAVFAAEDETEGIDGAAGDELIAEDIEPVKALPAPTLPSQDEIYRHWIDHLPFRSWCGTRINGRGRERPHTRAPGRRRIPTLCFDYCFISKDGVFTRKE